jgi:hypothetical protein
MLCKLCGGNFGNANPVTGDHYLCEIRNIHNVATPCLGMKCKTCNGSGVKHGSRDGVMLSLELHPAQIAHSIAAQFPTCNACNGKGYTL